MEIKLNNEQRQQFSEEKDIDIKLSNNVELYFKFDENNNFSYAKIINNPCEFYDTLYTEYESFSFNAYDLKLLMEEEPYFAHKNPRMPECPNCLTPLIYKFNYCPKCGKRIMWKK